MIIVLFVNAPAIVSGTRCDVGSTLRRLLLLPPATATTATIATTIAARRGCGSRGCQGDGSRSSSGGGCCGSRRTGSGGSGSRGNGGKTQKQEHDLCQGCCYHYLPPLPLQPPPPSSCNRFRDVPSARRLGWYYYPGARCPGPVLFHGWLTCESSASDLSFVDRPLRADFVVREVVSGGSMLRLVLVLAVALLPRPGLAAAAVAQSARVAPRAEVLIIGLGGTGSPRAGHAWRRRCPRA